MNTKTALLSTTFCMAMSVSAQAAEIVLETEGEVTIGFNDMIVDNSYLVGEFELEASQNFDNGFGWALSYELEGEKLGWGNDVDYDDAILLEFETPIGTLAYGDMDKKGASDLYYNDLDGMAIDVVRYKDGYPSLRWEGNIGNTFSYAISTRDLNNGDDQEFSVGLGYENDRFELGVGWDNGSAEQDEAWGVSLTLNGHLGGAETEYKVSYVESGGESAIGLSVEAEFEMGLTIEVSYAINNAAGDDNAYAFAVEYETGPLTIEASYEFDGGEEYEIALAYEFDGFAPEGTTLYAGYAYEEGSDEDTGFYVGAGFGIAKNAVLGIAYSETGDGGDLETYPGWSAMLTISF